MTRRTYKAGTPSAHQRSLKSAATRAANRAAHEAELARRRERDRKRREEKRAAEAEAERKHQAQLARRRELYAQRKEEERRRAAEAAYRAPTRLPNGRFGPSQATLDRRAQEQRAVEVRERIRQRAREATTRRMGEEARATYEEARARVEAAWQRWAEQAMERVDDVRVNYREAADRLVDPFDPRAFVTFRILLRYVDSQRVEEHDEWYLAGKEGELAEAWADSGILPPDAATAPVEYFWEETVTTSPVQLLNRVFSASFVRAIATRVEPAPDDPRSAQLVESASGYVRDVKAYRNRQKEQAARRKARKDGA